MKTEHFESVRDIVQRLEKPPEKGTIGASKNDLSFRFHGENGTLKNAMQWLEHGWPEGAALAKEQSGKIGNLLPRGTRNRWTSDIVGVIPNVPAHLAGTPDRMLAFHPRENQVGGWQNLELIIPLGFNSCVDFSTAKARGVAYVALVDVLETYRIRCKVTGVMSNGYAEGSSVTFRVKGYKEPLILNDLAFMVGHPCMLRRIGFGLLERSPIQEISDVARHMGYGNAVDVTLEHVPEAGDNAIIFPQLSDGDDSIEEHFNLLLEYLPPELKELFDE